jgi:hypothetical protein
MGLRSTFIPIKNLDDLTAICLMQEALDDVANYACVYGIVGFCELKGNLFACFSQDGSTGCHYYRDFSPSFRNFKLLDDLTIEGKAAEGRLKGARYFDTPREVEQFLEKKGEF